MLIQQILGLVEHVGVTELSSFVSVDLLIFIDS